MSEGEYLNIIWEQARTIEELNHQVELLSFELLQIKMVFEGVEKNERDDGQDDRRCVDKP